MVNKWGEMQKFVKGHLSGFNKVKGNYGEDFIAYELLKRNIGCSKNMLEDSVDLFIKPCGGIKTVQVKTSGLNKNTKTASCFIGDDIYRRKIDYFAFVLLDDDMLRNIRAVCANCHSKIHNKDNLRKTSTKKKKSVNLVPSYNGGLLG